MNLDLWILNFSELNLLVLLIYIIEVSKMTKQEAWEMFKKTGKIEYYLEYKKAR